AIHAPSLHDALPIFEPLQRARWQAARQAAVVIAVLGALTFLWVRRLLMPLQLLQQRALSLFEAGRSVHDGWPDASGEVAALAQRSEEHTSELQSREK